MRMRKKKNGAARMELCRELLVEAPENNKGNWNAYFQNDHSLHLEIGCGKGGFITTLAAMNPAINYVAIERYHDALLLTLEKAMEQKLPNLRFIRVDGAKLEESFAKGEINRIYLNFSDPWPKARHAKRRLTSPGFVALYRALLHENGKIVFKTDNQPLFHYSLETFRETDWRLEHITFDLHNSPLNENNIMTEYEKTFSEKGFPIHQLEAYPV